MYGETLNITCDIFLFKSYRMHVKNSLTMICDDLCFNLMLLRRSNDKCCTYRWMAIVITYRKDTGMISLSAAMQLVIYTFGSTTEIYFGYHGPEGPFSFIRSGMSGGYYIIYDPGCRLYILYVRRFGLEIVFLSIVIFLNTYRKFLPFCSCCKVLRSGGSHG